MFRKDLFVLNNALEFLKRDKVTSRSYVNELNSKLTEPIVSTEDFSVKYSNYGVNRLTKLINARIEVISSDYNKKYNYKNATSLYYKLVKNEKLALMLEKIDAASNQNPELLDKFRTSKYTDYYIEDEIATYRTVNIFTMLNNLDYLSLVLNEEQLAKARDLHSEYLINGTDIINSIVNTDNSESINVPYLLDFTKWSHSECPFEVVNSANNSIITLEDFGSIGFKLYTVSELISTILHKLEHVITNFKLLDLYLHITSMERIITFIDSKEVNFIIDLYKILSTIED